MKVIELLCAITLGAIIGCLFSGFAFIPFMLSISITLGLCTLVLLLVNLFKNNRRW